jgi:hypothetical protein
VLGVLWLFASGELNEAALVVLPEPAIYGAFIAWVLIARSRAATVGLLVFQTLYLAVFVYLFGGALLQLAAAAQLAMRVLAVAASVYALVKLRQVAKS